MNTRTSAFRRFIDGASGPYLLSVPALAWTYCVTTLSSVWTATAVSDSSPWVWFFLSTIAHSCALVVALFFRSTVLPVTPRPARPLLALAALISMGLIRGTILTVLVHVTGVELFTGSLFRPIGSTVLVVIAGALIAWTVQENQNYRQTITELEATAHALEQSRGSLEMIIRAERQRILDVISTNVLSPVGALRESLAASKLDRESIALAVNRITELIDHSVKPLSRRLHDEVMTWSPQPSVRNRIAARADITKIRTSVPLAPVAQGLALVAVTPAVLSVQFGLRTALSVAIAGALVLTATVWLCKEIINALQRELPFTRLVVATIASLLIASTAVWAYGTTVVGGTMPEVLAVGGAIAVFTSGLVISTAILARRAGQVREQDLRSLNAELASSVSRISSQVWMHQNRIAEVLHGDVQSSLIVAAARLANTDAFGALNHNDVEQLLKPVEEAVRGLESSEQIEESIDSFKAELQSVWSGVVDVHMDVGDGAHKALSDDSELLTLAAALIREAVGNAYRHGQAKNVNVTLEVSEQGLELTVTNPGTAPRGERKGLGTQLLNAGTLSWTRAHASGTTTLSALLPVQNDHSV